MDGASRGTNAIPSLDHPTKIAAAPLPPSRYRATVWRALILLVPSAVPTCTSFDPLAYVPHDPPALAGDLAPNDHLRLAEALGVGLLATSEDIALDQRGRIYGWDEHGSILRLTISPNGDERVEVFAETGGRPLGLHFDAAGNLVVADAMKGLLSIDATGTITILSTEAQGLPLHFTEDVDIAADGRIYFSDASSKWGIEETVLDLLEGRPHGRLLRFDPATSVGVPARCSVDTAHR